MSFQFVVQHCFCTGQPGRAVVTVEIDGKRGALWPEEAEQLAKLIVQHAILARTAEAEARAAGAEVLASTPSKGTA